MLTKSRSLAPVYTDGHPNYSPSSVTRVKLASIPDIEQWLRDQRDSTTLNYTRAITGPLGTEIFSSSRRPKPRYNACLHDNFQVVMRPLTYVYAINGLTYGTRYMKYAVPVSTIPGGFDHLETDVRYAANRAWWTMQPRFEGAVSMLNFLYELKDFRDIAKFALKLDLGSLYGLGINLRMNLQRELRKARKNLTRGTEALLRNNVTLRLPAVLQLLNSFMVQPLIKDLSAIMAQMGATVLDAEARFFEAGQGLQKTHYSEVIGVHSNLTLLAGNNRNQYQGEYWSTLFTATMEYKYKYTMRGKMQRFLQYWGLNGSWEAYWNMLPFSFLPDYVIGIGKSIKAMELDPNVDLLQHQYCESLLTEGGYGRFIAARAGAGIGMIIDDEYIDDFTPRIISGVRLSRYERVLTEPSKGAYVPKTKWPSTNQWLNVLALVRCFL